MSTKWVQISLMALAAILAALPGAVAAQELLANGGVELEPFDFGGRDEVPPMWEMSEGPPVSAGFPPPNEGILMSLAEPSDFTHRLLEGDWQMWFQPYNGTFANQTDNFAHLTQTVAGTPGLTYTMKGWALFEDYFPGGVTNLNLTHTNGTPTGAPFDDGPPSPTDTFFALEFLDSGGAVLPGSVEVELKANGQPSNTTWFEHILTGTSPAGTTNVRVRASMLDGVLNPLPNPQNFSMSFFVDKFSLTAVAAPTDPGDFDVDGDVDGNDFLKWQRGESPFPNTIGDLNLWRSNFGNAVVAGAAVPEPTTAALSIGLLGLVAWAARRQRA